MAERAQSDALTAATRGTERLDSLTSLRFVFAFVVFWYHATNLAPFETKLFNGAYGGVGFFFLLSGFVMSWSTQPGTPTGRFYLKRFARIYPLYFTAWACAMAVQLISNPNFADDFVAVTLLQSWFPSKDIFLGASAPFWSLSVEAFLYAMFPLIHLVLIRLTKRGLAIAAGVGFAMSAIAPISLYLTNASNHLWLGYVFPPTRLGEFIIGAAAGAAYLQGFRVRLPVIPVALLATAAFLTSPYVPTVFGYYFYTLIPYAILILTFATVDLDGRSTWLRHPVAVRLGDWSYGFYLFHAMTIAVCLQISRRIGHDMTTNTLAFWVTSVCAFAIALTVAGVAHHRIELPMVRRIGRRARRTPAAAAQS